MNTQKLLSCVTLLMLSLCRSHSSITADELATFLGIHTWETTVLIPEDSIEVELFQIVDGDLGKRLFQAPKRMSSDASSPLRIIIGPRDGDYAVNILDGRTTFSVAARRPPEGGPTVSPTLGETTKEGDYVLMGRLKEITGYELKRRNEVSRYSTGFLLRIRRAPGNAEK